MNQQRGKTLVTTAFMIAFFWGFVTEIVVFAAGKIATPHGWLPITVMVVAFLVSLAGLSWFTSETR